MGCDSVVPKDDGVGRPLYASLIVSALVDVIIQEIQNSICMVKQAQ
jgi:hypothetical protein